MASIGFCGKVRMTEGPLGEALCATFERQPVTEVMGEDDVNAPSNSS
jgi:hypothetical protein